MNTILSKYITLKLIKLLNKLSQLVKSLEKLTNFGGIAIKTVKKK